MLLMITAGAFLRPGAIGGSTAADDLSNALFPCFRNRGAILNGNALVALGNTSKILENFGNLLCRNHWFASVRRSSSMKGALVLFFVALLRGGNPAFATCP